MPARIARSSVPLAVTKKARDKSRKRNLDAYSIASHEVPVQRGVRRHRLGEIVEEEPRQKRQRTEPTADSEDSGDDAPSANHGPRAARSENVEQGSDSDGNEWTLGGLRDDDEDSELDSDDAFGESDEERFAGFTFRGSSSLSTKPPAKRRARTHDIEEAEDAGFDLHEAHSLLDSNDEETSGGEEGVDLATMLDDSDQEEQVRDSGDLDGDEISSESDNDDDDEQKSASESEADESSGDEGDEERIARMRDRLEALDPKQQGEASARPLQHSSVLTVEDLLADLDPAARKQFTAPLKTRKKSERAKTLTAPLAPRQQSKLNREAASKTAKDQLDRWRDTVIQNRRADFLSFPLQDPNRGEPLGKERLVPGTPRTELEQHISKIMEDSGLGSKPESGQEDTEEAIMKSEALAEKEIPIEEVMRRRAELRRTRDLLFREEIKAKRIAKIKSKSYRRVHRRERQRIAQAEGEQPDEDDRERADRSRAAERMSTKHRESKWAKSLKATNKTIWDDGARQSVHEQARRNEELRRRIAGEDVNGQDQSDIESDSAGLDEEHAGTMQQLDCLQEAGRDDDYGKGLAGMKFMRDAEERRRQQNDNDVERLRKELAVEDGDEEEEGDEEGFDVAHDTLGRAVFGPGSRSQETSQSAGDQTRLELQEGELSGDEDKAIEWTVSASRPQADRTAPLLERTLKAHPDSARDKAPGPSPQSGWLTTSSKRKGRSQTRNDDLVTFATNASHSAEKTSSKDDARASHHGESNRGDAESSGRGQALQDNEVSEDDPEAVDPVVSQNEISRQRAFAGADVKAAFDAEKADAIVSEDEKEVSSYLPGWGSWTGEGLSKSVRKAANKQRHNPIYKTKLAGVKAADRQDARLENVLISEKQDRKGKKFKADILPHEFEKRAQYERALRVPIGPEFVTKATFQNNTRPRVVVKPGVVVAPMERPLV